MTPAEIVSGAFRGVEYAGLLGFVGVVVMRQLARQPPHLSWVRPSMERALALALLGGVTTVAQPWGPGPADAIRPGGDGRLRVHRADWPAARHRAGSRVQRSLADGLRRRPGCQVGGRARDARPRRRHVAARRAVGPKRRADG